jgi:hypothetical protein
VIPTTEQIRNIRGNEARNPDGEDEEARTYHLVGKEAAS